MGLYDNDELQRYVQELGMRLARSSQRPNLPWSFAVVDSPAVNAFALPGGYIYITRGILPYLDNEAQLVGVLGHEIGHVTARHSAQQYTRGMGASLGVLVGSIFVPQVRPFGDLAAGQHRHAVPQVRTRRRDCRPTRWAPSTRPGADGIPTKCPRS